MRSPRRREHFKGGDLHPDLTARIKRLEEVVELLRQELALARSERETEVAALEARHREEMRKNNELAAISLERERERLGLQREREEELFKRQLADEIRRRLRAELRIHRLEEELEEGGQGG